jgi:hypothetical protein
MKINTKTKFYELWLSGQLGNRMGAWRADKYQREDVINIPFVGVRSLRPGGKFLMPVLPEDIGREISLNGGRADEWVVCEGTPNQYDASSACQVVVQGELQECVGGWYFYHSFSSEPMRKALSLHGRHASGVGVREFLKSTCSQGSFDELEDLFSCYPGHVIELSVHSRCLGDTPGRNTIIWEVRNY